jgi:hypothetical protein
MAHADAAAAERVADLTVMERMPLLPAAPPPAFIRKRPGAMSISSWKTMTSVGASLKNFIASPTERPLSL